MGMFDSIYSPDGIEWQTKALACLLNRYEVGDEIEGPPIDYQMEVIGGRNYWKFVTIRNGRVAEVGVDRDLSLSVREYSSGWLRPGELTFQEQQASADRSTE